MTHYATCTNCAVDKATCARRKQITDGLRGLSVYSLKFRCADRKALFHAGQRIKFDWTYWDDCNEGYPVTFNGTVVREVGTKFVVQVDDARDDCHEIEAKDVFTKTDVLMIKVRPADMRALNEPDRRVCESCFEIEGGEPRCYWQDGPWRVTPDGCIRHGAEALESALRGEMEAG